MTEPRVVRGSVDQGIEGWHLAPCAYCPDGRIYVENGSREPAKCNACRETKVSKTMTKKKKSGANGAHTVSNDCDLEVVLADGGKKVGPRYSDRLPVPIEGAELDSAATEFARLYRQREATLEQRRDQMAGFRKTLDGIDEQMKPLADTVENHTRLGDIECQDVLCRDNTVRVYRLDTGEATGEVKAADTFDFDEANGQDDGDDTEPPPSQPPPPVDGDTTDLAQEQEEATT